ncbi:GATOR complex protein WDR24 [Aricia agestis]|uniref:GATOR complex protein WDR24 n=1 Tax=Aricia agestis TaxID=91739 RepID=UPI001C201DCE|nr:GATOR complex protein WDR24 [Aricia agestis]
MIPSGAICVSEEGPANALALNKDSTQVVIAGRNVFKVFSIGENEFTEVYNLRVGKNLNLNFSSIDVAWSQIDENTLATAATNGAVVVWNLGRLGRSKQEHVFSDHKRSVNKVSFHLTEPGLLISGSQDGMMKCFDLRMKEVARTFISNTESIRDVQFSPHAAHVLAAVSENGTVQLWDSRRHERPLHHYTAHSGPVFACDWHPHSPWLATASRDKTIKVWDIQARPSLEHTIYTIASVGHVKWRPARTHQLASCALVLDCSVHVWDVRRPHVPLATFAEHRDVTTAIAWQGPAAFLATSRDCGLYRHRFHEAAHPVLWANPHGVCVSARGHVAHAAPERPLALPAVPPAPPAAPAARAAALPRKQPTAGSLGPAAQAALERDFAASAASSLLRLRPPPAAPLADTLAAARLFRVRGQPPHLLAEHNAKVARDHKRFMVSHVWEVVRVICSAPTHGAGPAPAPPPPRLPPPAEPAPPPPYPAPEEEPLEEAEEWADSGHHKNSGVLGMPTHSIYIPPAKYCKRDDENGGWVSAASAHYVDVDATDWTLPEEAFPLRAAPAPALPVPAPQPPEPEPEPEAGALGAPAPAPAASSPGGSSGSGTSSSGSTAPPPVSPQPQRAKNMNNFSHESVGGGESEVGSGGGTGTRAGGAGAAAMALLARALRLHAELGDVQTAALVCCVLADRRAELLRRLDDGLPEQWLLGYVELLQRHKLFNRAAEVIKCAWVGSVWSLSQQSTAVAACCGRCGRRTRARTPCECAGGGGEVCAVCGGAVRGLYAWCQGCAHGGHLLHLRDWVRRHQLCPAGCGHHCTLD